MKVSEVKEEIRRLAELYFTGATVTFTKQSFLAKPMKPLVTLSSGAVSRVSYPPMKVLDGRPVFFYPASVPIQIDLFTRGRMKKPEPGMMLVAENTAEDDLLGFADFLNSEFVTQWCHEKDIAILLPDTVQDLTGLLNDTNYEYRAMLEITVYFTMPAIGYTGTLAAESVKHEDGNGGGDIQADDVSALEPIVQTTPSGGGNEDLAGQEEGYFSNVEINGNKMKEEKER